LKLYKSLSNAVKERTEVEALKITVSGPQFPPELLMFTNLKELYLEGDIQNFPRIGHPWEKLKILSLKWPAFKGDISGVFTLPSLENLKIIDTPLKRLTFPLGQINAPLKSLTLKSCSLEFLPEEFSMLTNLEELNASGNELMDLPQSFPALQKLRRLNLDANAFEIFPDLVKGMKSLTHLSIDRNRFSEDEKARIQRNFHIWPE
jgi:Leucine-rich repeat (LRR) protein